MNFSINDFFSKCDPADLVTYTEEILNEKLHFLRSVRLKFLASIIFLTNCDEMKKPPMSYTYLKKSMLDSVKQGTRVVTEFHIYELSH